jgi:hypothetical protein
VPHGGNALHTAKQRHQVRNLNAFERMHGILDLPAQPFVDATGDEPIELLDRVLPCETDGKRGPENPEPRARSLDRPVAER